MLNAICIFNLLPFVGIGLHMFALINANGSKSISLSICAYENRMSRCPQSSFFSSVVMVLKNPARDKNSNRGMCY